ncbi:hypothetical protein INQ51_20105 [Maribellus sp. CM-23]|uniref:DUF5723 family protein n=1 Tax=Maribellus sp. CM-23 TaxID=2781026 RepID=UPI001F2EDE28|nr:DUF5723 family protein [Maribellus sp. CM-23]MCE4566635.1 hypothetical protein [Maribellus sp. CM-23]
MYKAPKRIIIILIILLSGSITSWSQEGNALQFIRSVSQSANTNPAYQNEDERMVIGLPFLSGLTLDWKANFAPDYIFAKRFSYSFDRFFNELGEPGDAFPSATVPVFYISKRQGLQNFSFSVSEKTVATTNFDHHILHFIDQGLLPYYNREKETFGPLSFNAFHYREVAFGYSNQIWDGLTIGIRPKLLFARFLYDVSDLHVEVETDTEQQQLLVTPRGTYTLAGPIDVTYKEEEQATFIRPNPQPGDYFFNFHNLSPAIDLGLTYRFDKKTEVAVSLLDLGYLGFKHRAYDVQFTGPLRYAQEELYQSNNPDSPINYKEPKLALQDFSDRTPYIVSGEPVKKRVIQKLPLKMIAGIKTRLSKTSEAGISNQFTSYPDRSYNYLTAFYHTGLGERWNLAGTVSLYKTQKILPGIGASYTGRRAQYFLSTNNITGLIKPSSAKSLNLSFGVNFLFSTFQN